MTYKSFIFIFKIILILLAWLVCERQNFFVVQNSWSRLIDVKPCCYIARVQVLLVNSFGHLTKAIVPITSLSCIVFVDNVVHI